MWLLQPMDEHCTCRALSICRRLQGRYQRLSTALLISQPRLHDQSPPTEQSPSLATDISIDTRMLATSSSRVTEPECSRAAETFPSKKQHANIGKENTASHIIFRPIHYYLKLGNNQFSRSSPFVIINHQGIRKAALKISEAAAPR